MATIESKVTAQEGVLFQEVSGEAVLLNQATGKYFSLDETGTRMWNALMKKGRLEAALKLMVEEFDASEDQIREDLLDLANKLEEHGLLRVD